MKRLIYTLLMCAGISIFPTALQAQQLSAKRIAIIEKQIDSIFTDNLKAGEAVDMDKLAQSVDDSRKTGFISGGAYYAAFDSLLEKVKAGKNGIARQEYVLGQKKITVLSEKDALVTASGTSTLFTTSGSTFSVKFAWTFVYEKINNVWKVIHSHQSAVR
ncbi:MAG: nuclear transport factor 2 family protein [Bacteroidota bacterium]|nr:nuclear transport factor 2 family protein [Bacteroidota bacterium]